jgi:hypothetical protein
MDPEDKLEDREYVYKLLVGLAPEKWHTNPKKEERGKSMIPWSQENFCIVKDHGGSACGGMVKMTFRKYMGWGLSNQGVEPCKKSIYGWDAIGWIVKSLKALQPVRAHLGEREHYIGIVGYRYRGGRYEFLCIDPWAGHPEKGNITITYAGVTTKFLGIVVQEGKRLIYGKGVLENPNTIDEIEGYLPMNMGTLECPARRKPW